MNKKLLTLLVVPILLAATTAAVYGQAAPMEDGVTVDALLELFDNANATIYTVLTTIEDRGVTIPPEVWDNYDKGLAKAGEAVQLRDAGNFAEAKGKVLEAMQHLRAAILAVAEDLEGVETPEEQEARKAAGIQDAIERIETRIDRLEAMADNAEAQGLDASKITDRLTLVKGLLEDVKGHIDAGDMSAAEEGVEMSQREFGEAMAELRPITDAIKVNQAGRFLDTAEERLSSISGTITDVIEDLPIPELAKNMIRQRVGQGIQTAQDKIAEIRSLLQEGRVNEAMPMLDELRADIANVMAEVEQQIPGIGVALENIDRREIVLEVLEDTAEILSGKGVDVSTLLGKIEEARGLVLAAVESLKEGNLEAVEAKLAQVDGIIEEAKDLADQLVAQG